MAKPDLALPLSELEDYGTRLRDIKRRMNHTKKMFESYRDDIGDGGVYDKLEEFESNWEDGREESTSSSTRWPTCPTPSYASSRSSTTTWRSRSGTG